MEDHLGMQMESDNNLKRNQVFVRNLPFDTTSEDLMTLFQEFGPVKRASVAAENGVAKGYGFVKFAVEDDAERAVKELSGHAYKGRQLQLEISLKRGMNPLRTNGDGGALKADSKPADHTSSIQPRSKISVALEAVTKRTGASASTSKDSKKTSSAETAPEATEAAQDSAVGKEGISRSLRLVIWGIPTGVTKQHIKKLVSKNCRKAEVQMLGEQESLMEILQALAPQGKIALVSVPSRQYVDKLLKELSDKPWKLLFKPILESTDSVSGSFTIRKLTDLTEPALRRRKCRLIIRNLSFQASEQNISDRLGKFGPLCEVLIPKTEVSSSKAKGDEDDEGKRLKPRGYGFVTFLCESDAARVVSSSIGLKVCNRDVAIDYCTSKDFFEKGYSHELAGQGSQEQGKGEGEGEEEGNPETAEAADDTEQATDVDNSDKRDVKDDNDGSEAGDKDDVEEGRTVFLRDLAFDTKQDDIKASLSRFGQILFVAIVRDPHTNICKGSAFVKFATRECALRCVEAVENTTSPPPTSTSNKLGNKLDQLGKRSATASTGNEEPLLILDRPFRADIAVSREEAQQMQSDHDAKSGKGKPKLDKRNLYLANEGLHTDSDKKKDSNAPLLLSAEEREKRMRAQSDKRKKLLNPLYFVSATRLSVRNLPKMVSDNDLKIMCVRALKAGLAKSNVSTIDVLSQLTARGIDYRKARAKGENITEIPSHTVKNCIKSAKVMLDLKRLKDGVPHSRGYGFVEFSHHIHALSCLRELNNSVDYVKYLPDVVQHSMRTSASRPLRLMVEFSLENFNKVQLLAKREEAAKAKKAGAPDEHADDEEQGHRRDAAAGGAGGDKKRARGESVDSLSDNDDDYDDDANDYVHESDADSDVDDEVNEENNPVITTNNKVKNNSNNNSKSNSRSATTSSNESTAAVTVPLKKQRTTPEHNQQKQQPREKRLSSTANADATAQQRPSKKQKNNNSKDKKEKDTSNPGFLARQRLETESVEEAAARRARKEEKRRAAENKRKAKISKRQEKKGTVAAK